MKKNILFFLVIINCIINTYAFEMSDLSVGDFSLIHESTGKIFNFYDPLERLYRITKLKFEGEEYISDHNPLNVKNNFFSVDYLQNKNSYEVITKTGGWKVELSPTYFPIRMVVYKEFKTIRGIGIGSSLEEILKKYDNCYIGNSKYDDIEFIVDDGWLIWEDSMILYKGQKELLNKNNKINCVFMVVELREFDRLLDLSVCDGIYYVLKFNLDENRNVRSIKFSTVPYLP